MSSGHIRKRGDSWQAIAYVGIVDGKKKYTSRTTKTKKEAQRLLTELQHQINTNTFSDPGKITFGEHLDNFLEKHCKLVAKFSHNSLVTYSTAIEAHIKPMLGRIKLSKLQSTDIDRYIYDKLNNGLSASTVHLHYRIIYSALKRAVKSKLIIHNVAEAADAPKVEIPEIQIVDVEVCLSIFRDIRRRNESMVLPLLLCLFLGLRRGESLGLLWDNLDLETGYLSVEKQLQEVDKELLRTKLKTKSSKRKIMLPGFLLNILTQHKKEQVKLKLSLGKGYNNNGFICCKPDGQPINPRSLTNTFVLSRKSLGLKVRLHDLRHFAATRFLEDNANPKAIVEMFGWSSLKMLDRYGHQTMVMQQELSGLMQEKLKAIEIDTGLTRALKKLPKAR